MADLSKLSVAVGALVVLLNSEHDQLADAAKSASEEAGIQDQIDNLTSQVNDAVAKAQNGAPTTVNGVNDEGAVTTAKIADSGNLIGVDADGNPSAVPTTGAPVTPPNPDPAS